MMYNTYQRLPTSANFMHDVESGFQSTNFNLAENIEAGDSRHGLDEITRQEVFRIMKRQKVNFDEARRLHMEERLCRAYILR